MRWRPEPEPNQSSNIVAMKPHLHLKSQEMERTTRMLAMIGLF